MQKFILLNFTLTLFSATGTSPTEANHEQMYKWPMTYTSSSSSSSAMVFMNLKRRASNNSTSITLPSSFKANPSVGPGGSLFRDSAHFRIYGNAKSSEPALKLLEGAYACFVNELGWRSTGLSFNDKSNTGSTTKINIYSVNDIPGAEGFMGTDAPTGMAFIKIRDDALASPDLIHEFGHALHYHQQSWVDQALTGAWWETVANWVQETFMTSSLCESARRSSKLETSQETILDFKIAIGESFRVIVDAENGVENHYHSWMFFTYLTNNPDRFTGLGKDVMLQLMVQYKPKSNETPLHTLQRVCTGASVNKLVGTYWARMAYVDIDHKQAQVAFFARRSTLNFANVDSLGGDRYRVKSARRPRYMGANIIPLKEPSGKVTVKINSNGNLTTHLVLRNKTSGAVKYILFKGSGSVDVKSGDEVSLVVANTPESLVLFDPFKLSPEVNTGVDYDFTLSGAKA